MQYLHLAILPVEGSSVVIAFYHKRDKLYRRLRHQINSISENEVLKYINYLVFKYTENYYISKKIESEIDANESLQRLAQENDGNPNLGMLGVDNFWGLNYKPVDKNEIPNFLEKEWAVWYLGIKIRLPITGDYPVVRSLCTSMKSCIHINADVGF